MKRAKPTQDAALEASLSKRKTPLMKTTKLAKSIIPLDSSTSQTTPARPDGGDKTTSIHLGVFLGLEASVIKNPAIKEKLAQSFLLFVGKETAGKMELDEVATQFYHVATQFYHVCSQVNKYEHLYLDFNSFEATFLGVGDGFLHS